MEHGIAIIPPEIISNQIQKIQNQFGDNGVEPHITIKAQGGLGDDLKWMEIIKSIAKETTPFNISFGEAKKFGDGVLFISVNSPDIITLHNRIIDKLNLPQEIVQKYFEKELFTPHLTLGMTQTGFNSEDFSKMKESADEIFNGENICFTAEFMRVYNLEPNNCTKLEDVYFTG